MKTDNNLAEGSVFSKLLAFSLPLMLTNLLQASLNLTDMIIVSFFKGTASFSAIGMGGLITYLIINGVTGLCGGLTLLVGRLYGAKRHSDIKVAIANSIVVLGVLSVVISVGVIASAKVWLRLLATPPQAMAEAKRYVTLSMCGLLFVFVYNEVAAVSKGLGDGKLPLVIILVAVVVNIGMDLGIIALLKASAGFAAVSNIVAEGVAAVLGIIILAKKQPLLRLRKQDFRLDMPLLKQVIKLGTPLGLLNATATLSFMLLTYIVNRLGGDAAIYTSSAHAIATKYNGIALLPARAVCLAIGAMVSQNLGAKKAERNKQTLLWGLVISVGVGVVLTGFSYLLPSTIYALFGAESRTASYGIAYMKIMSLDYIIVPFAVCAYGIADGYGKTYITMAINIVSSIAIRVPAAYLFGQVAGLGMQGVGLAIVVASVGSVVMSWLYIVGMKSKPLSSHKARLD